MDNRHIKRCSTLICIREMQIQITMRYYLIHIRIAIIKKIGNSKYGGGKKEKGTLVYFWWDCKLCTTIMENIIELTQKLKMQLPYNYTSGYLSKENENTNLERYMYPYVHCSII